MHTPTHQDVEQAAKRLQKVVTASPLQYNERLSQKYQANIYLKREDQQKVRSFKIRGAYNKMAQLTPAEKKAGIVCASAGNHAQGVALSCSLLKVTGTIFMPKLTPNQKVEKVKTFGGKYVQIQLVGTTFDEASTASKEYQQKHHATYVHPFDDPDTIAGQGTVGLEIANQLKDQPDIVMTTIGGGGLLSGTSIYLTYKYPDIRMYGVEPSGAAGMYASLKKGSVTTLDTIDTFVDGAAVKTVGELTYKIISDKGIPVLRVPEGQACTTMVELYQSEGIITEPAGILPISALQDLNHQLRGKTVVCVISGGNNDLLRYPDILERSLIHQGKKHYFIINFAQKPGHLKNFVSHVLSPTDDIVRFEYIKKTNAEKGPAFIGIQLNQKEDLKPLLERMKKHQVEYQKVRPDDLLYKHLV